MGCGLGKCLSWALLQWYPYLFQETLLEICTLLEDLDEEELYLLLRKLRCLDTDLMRRYHRGLP